MTKLVHKLRWAVHRPLFTLLHFLYPGGVMIGVTFKDGVVLTNGKPFVGIKCTYIGQGLNINFNSPLDENPFDG